MTCNNEDIDIERFLPYMREASRCERALRELGVMWQMIDSAAKINCAEEAHNMLGMMAATRRDFEILERDMVRSLVQESVQELMRGIHTCAHQVMDTMVRNLYERTADVGFLATDQSLCSFVAGLSDGDGEGIAQRLREYRSTYTVYDDVLLFAPDGRVLAQAHDSAPVPTGAEAQLIAHTLEREGYVETFGASALRPGKRHALLYTQRMLHPQTGSACGVLCLSFDFEGEVRSLFQGNRGAASGRTVAMVLDAQDTVIASSNAQWVALGTQVPTNLAGEPRLLIYNGRYYLVKTVASGGYQGYPGPEGWKGQVMIALDLAFSEAKSHCVQSLPEDVAQGLLSHAKSFCPPLYGVLQTAHAIRREVWNGQVMTAGRGDACSRLKAVLEQVAETGARTNQVVTHAIRELYDMVLSAGLREHQSLTLLLVDLLERNLYERANDCRWWARSPVLRQLLTDCAQRGGPPSAELLAQASQVLEHINSLYTVYVRLMVYDASGRVLCASHPQLPDGTSVLGQHIEPATLQALKQLKDAQAYYVSPWGAQHTGAQGSTYIFHAPIRASDAGQRTVGGIGIVFNAIPQLQAMLQGSLGGKPDAQAMYLTRQGVVLASTDPASPPGSRVHLPDAQWLALRSGESAAAIAVYQGQYCILGCSAARGYREFKASDSCREEILALSFEPFGQVRSRVHTVHDVQGLSVGQHSAVQMATFYVGSHLLAMRAQAVREALAAACISPVSAGRLPCCLGTMALQLGSAKDYVWVFDLGEVFSGQRTPVTEQSEVVIVEHDEAKLGILVSGLHGVHHFLAEHIIAAPSMAGSTQVLAHALIHELIKVPHSGMVVQCINPQALLHSLLGKPGLGRGVAQSMGQA